LKQDEVFLKHILESIEKIESFTEGVQKDEFMELEEKQDAVIRKIEIIGEAVKNVSDAIKEKYPEIPWIKIAGTRDKLIHEYHGVDLEIVWAVLKEELPH